MGCRCEFECYRYCQSNDNTDGRNYLYSDGETTIKEALTVFPNPTKGNFRYQGNLSKTTNGTIEIMNQLGQRVRQIQFEKTNTIDLVIDLNDLPNGIYILNAFDNQLIDRQKIVLQR